MTEREYWPTRCLRLEAEVVALKQERAAAWPLTRIRRVVQPDDIAQMRELRARGLKYNQIGIRLGWADTTVARFVKDVPIEMPAQRRARGVVGE